MWDLDAILARLVAMLQQEYGDQLLGVLVAGSFAYGKPGPTSDIDLHVLIEGVRRRRQNIVLQGMEIEMFINPPFQVPRYFDEGPATMHMYAFGRSLYDPRGAVREIQALARARWEAGPPALAAHLGWRERYLPADLLRDLEDLGESDEASSSLLIGRVVELLLETHYRRNGRWLEKPKRRISDLDGWDQQAAQLARQACACGPLGQRRDALEQLAQHVLGPLGGLMPLEWASEWEEMQP